MNGLRALLGAISSMNTRAIEAHSIPASVTGRADQNKRVIVDNRGAPAIFTRVSAGFVNELCTHCTVHTPYMHHARALSELLETSPVFLE